MADNDFPFQPGAMLHGAIMGAFRANDSNFSAWCEENGTTPSNARNVTFGVSKGPRSQALLARIIAAAGPDIVKAGYLARFERHLNEIEKKETRP